MAVGFDWRASLISQYANSPILTTMLDNWSQNIDQSADMDAFYNLIWNVDTAQGYGLDVWGRIVGVSRTLQVASGDFFGFEEALPGAEPFNQAPFYAGSGATENFDLSDDAYRTLILAKAFANICDGSIVSTNQLLMTLFAGAGDAYVTDGEDMTMTYTFTFSLSPVQAAIVENSGVLPKPVGVAASVVTP